MEPTSTNGAAVRFPPPLVYLGAVVLGVLLQWGIAPLRLPLAMPLRVAGALIVGMSGIAFVAPAVGHFRRIGQDLAPWTPTPEIVSTGIYRWTRNPMYVGMALLQTAIGIGLANGWILALVPVVIAAIQAIAIRHEEEYLEREFGEGYLSYKRSVRRWL